MIINLVILLVIKIQVHVYQKRRSTNSWEWIDDSSEVEFIVNKNCKNQDKVRKVALILSISADIPLARIPEDEDVFYQISVRKPDVEIIRSERDLTNFREKYISVLDSDKKRLSRD